MTTSLGYWNKSRLSLWRGMTPEQRDYDRYVGRFPPGEANCETAAGRAAIFQRDDPDHVYEPDCSCHINAPCNTCTTVEAS